MKKQSPPAPALSVNELAAMVETRDRLSREHDAVSERVETAIKSVKPGTYVASDGGVVRVYYSISHGTYLRRVEFTHPLSEIVENVT